MLIKMRWHLCLKQCITTDGYSCKKFCYYLGVKRHTVIRWIEQRGMPASKVGKLWRFKTADIGLKKAEPPMSGRLLNEPI
ncbi:MAG: helix-turn-helix domain-containing protein [Desulfitobacteriia bacterium]